MKTFKITEGEITGISLVNESPYGKEYNFIHMTKKDWTPTVNDLSYYPLLKEAIDYFKGEDSGHLIECGTGHGSTQLLHDYIGKAHDFVLHSFETDKNWLSKFTHLENDYHKLHLVTDWRNVFKCHSNADIIFVDHAPGEDRKLMIMDFIDTKGIIVVHDTELGQADHGYRTRATFKHFKYVVEVRTSGAWANALSNEIDITKWIGRKYGNYEITAYDPTLKSEGIDD